MNKYAIVMFNTAILEPKIVNKDNIKIVNLHVFFEQEEFISDDLRELFDKVQEKNALPSSSQPTTQEIIDAYDKLNEYEHIFVVAPHLSISGTYNNALLSSKQMNNPDRYTIFETNSTSFCETIVVEQINSMQDKTVSEIVSKVNKLIPTLSTLTVPGSFDYLKKSGRVNMKEAIIGRLINLKLLVQSQNGTTDVYKKTRGLKGIVKEIENFIILTNPSQIYVATILPDEKTDQMFIDLSKKYGFKLELWESPSKIMATHLGPKTIGFTVRYEE